jgi:uncharacterized membrane protein
VKSIGKIFLTGLTAVVPVILTLYLIYWLIITAETVLGSLFQNILPNGWYQPGMGVVAGLLIVFLIGVMMHAWVVQKLYGWAEGLLYRIPLIRSVYGSIRELFNLFSHSHEQALHQTVILTLGKMRVIGFITRQNPSDLLPEIEADDHVIVYLPMSYNIAGYMVVVPRSAIQVINMSVEEALRFILTAGVAGKGHN